MFFVAVTTGTLPGSQPPTYFGTIAFGGVCLLVFGGFVYRRHTIKTNHEIYEKISTDSQI